MSGAGPAQSLPAGAGIKRATVPKMGRMMEVPPRFLAAVIVGGIGLSYLGTVINRRVFGTTPATFDSDFLGETKRIGPISERTNAPPVFRDPVRHRIPGYIRGPEDVESV